MDENRTMKPVEIVLRREEGAMREKNEGVESNLYSLKIYADVTMYLPCIIITC
jgi:hypothetical protein